MKKIFLLGFVISLAILSCDKIDDPYATNGTNTTDTNVVKTRKVLLEEFTGHTCVNCPLGALNVHSLQHDYPGKIISIAYHAGYYAKPQSTSAYLEDFRTTVGEAFATTFSIIGYPSAMVNRMHFPTGNVISNPSQWRDTVLAYKDKAPDAFLTISNSYTSPNLTCSVKCEFLNLLSGDYNLVVFLTEDSIMAPQKNGTVSAAADPNYPNPDALSYYHMHMLRDCISDASGVGVPIITGSAAAGDSVIKTFNYTLPANFNGAPPVGTVPVAKHCNVVAFIYNTATQEVIQAEEKEMQ